MIQSLIDPLLFRYIIISLVSDIKNYIDGYKSLILFIQFIFTVFLSPYLFAQFILKKYIRDSELLQTSLQVHFYIYILFLRSLLVMFSINSHK